MSSMRTYSRCVLSCSHSFPYVDETYVSEHSWVALLSTVSYHAAIFKHDEGRFTSRIHVGFDYELFLG